MNGKTPDQKTKTAAAERPDRGGSGPLPDAAEIQEKPRRLPFPFSLFSALYTKWFGPPPAAVGPILPDHSEVDLTAEEPGMLKSQLIFILITSFFAIALYWANTAELDKQVRADGSIVPTALSCRHQMYRLFRPVCLA